MCVTCFQYLFVDLVYTVYALELGLHKMSVVFINQDYKLFILILFSLKKHTCLLQLAKASKNTQIDWKEIMQ